MREPLLLRMIAGLATLAPLSPQGAVGDEGGYAGVAACQGCHREVYERWRRTAHGEAMGPAESATVRGDFIIHNRYAYGGNLSAMHSGNGHYRMTTNGPDGKPATYRVDYTLGIRQQQTYLARMGGGRIQVLPTIYDMTRGRWFDSAEGIVRVGRPLRPEDYFYWTNPGRTWNSQCAECHATGVRKGYDAQSLTYETRWADLSISCEACHGPGGRHAEDRTAGGRGEGGGMPRLRGFPPAQAVEVCAACHAKKHVLREGFLPGGDFLGHFDPVLTEDGDNFWPDGQDKLLAFSYHPFSEGRPFREGGLVCTDCHDPHGSDRPADLVLPPSSPDLCSRCHADLTDHPEAHGRHRAGSPGNGCVKCHMPSRLNETLSVTDHRMTVPVPENTLRFGSPNACNQGACHARRTADWAAVEAARLWGAYQEPHVRRADAMFRGARGERAAVEALAGVLTGTSEGPLARASAAALLGRIGALSGPGTLRAEPGGDRDPLALLVQALGDPHPTIRARSATALGKAGELSAIPALKGALRDSNVAVRIRAAFSLTTLGRLPVESDRDDRAALSDHRAWAHGFMADNPPARVTFGEALESRRDYRGALAEYRAALRIDPTEGQARARAETVLKEVEAGEKVRAMLGTALSANPSEARAHVALGLAMARWGDWRAALDRFGEALRLGAPGEAVLLGMGDSYRGAGHYPQAEMTYRKALEASPGSLGALRGLALTAYEEGKTEEGRVWEMAFRKAGMGRK